MLAQYSWKMFHFLSLLKLKHRIISWKSEEGVRKTGGIFLCASFMAGNKL